MPADTPPELVLEQLGAALDGCLLTDRKAARAQLKRLRRALRDGGLRPQQQRRLAALARRVERSGAVCRDRRAAAPALNWDPGLPVVAEREAIAAAIAAHPVVIVCGETGSGKSTQLPKICLSLDRGIAGRIGHTQPRRLAARTIAERVADELGGAVGETVGYSVRFEERLSDLSRVKLMTDGILLNELQHDRQLWQYDTIILDEAHERTLNIDFLAGCLKQLVRQRCDLRVIVTSATIDVERWSAFFDGAPVIAVGGKQYPVSVRYLADDDDDDADPAAALLATVQRLRREVDGDILAFLPGEHEIRTARERLAAALPGLEVLPLYARLPAAEQRRVFAPRRRQRVILSTNVAETSLTVPGVRAVIDSGRARISRYVPRTKVQRLPIEKISQASARQRAGRCGREGPGICERLYTEADFDARPEFTEPEIRRTGLAAVVLQMLAAGLGDIESFPFPDPPQTRLVNDAWRLLQELSAVEEDGTLTEDGRRLAQLPLDPRLGAMLLAADRFHCLAEVLVITAALSINDPRERPPEARGAADAAHAAFADARSDFLGYLKLFEAYEAARADLPRRRLAAWCREQFLAPQRMREWREVAGQLGEQCERLGLAANSEAADYDAIHKALLAGFVGNLARRDEEGAYQGCRGLRYRLHPSSTLARRPPDWVLVAEVAETRQHYGRDGARVRPAWAEEVAPHLVRREFIEPTWRRDQGRVVATVVKRLFGLKLGERSGVDFAAAHPEAARELFIQHALVLGEFDVADASLAADRALLEEAETLEQRLRRSDIRPADDALAELYRQRLPAEVYSAGTFRRWRKRAGSDALALGRAQLLVNEPGGAELDAFPEALHVAGAVLPLSYRFAPGADDDGVTVQVPLPLLGALDAGWFEAPVPGLKREKIMALLRTLPKARRRAAGPLAALADKSLAHLGEGAGPVLAPLAKLAAEATGLAVTPEDFRLDRLPAYLKARFEISDGGRILAAGRDLARLKRSLGEQAAAALSDSPGPGGARARHWVYGDLDSDIAADDSAAPRAFAALADCGDEVELRWLATPDEAARLHSDGVLRLARLACERECRHLARKLPDFQRMGLLYAPVGSAAQLAGELTTATFRAVLGEAAAAVRSEAAFSALIADRRAALIPAATELAQRCLALLEQYTLCRQALAAANGEAVVLEDLGTQLSGLVHTGCIARHHAELDDRLRYLRGLHARLERHANDPAKDARKLARVLPYAARLQAAVAAGRGAMPECREFHRQLEEFRLSVFAPEIKTAGKVSEKSLDALLSGAGEVL